MMMFGLFLAVLLCVSFALQETVPVVVTLVDVLLGLATGRSGLEPGSEIASGDLLNRAKILFLPAFFFASAMSVPFPGMLALAFAAGMTWDATNALVWGEGSPGFGSGPLLFGFLGSVANGARGLFYHGKRLLPVALAGVCVLVFLVSEYLWINFRAGDFRFPAGFWIKTAMTAVLTTAVVPLYLTVLTWGLRSTGRIAAAPKD